VSPELHKTFSIPHGGGGPGNGTHWCSFSPGDIPAFASLIKTGGDKAISAYPPRPGAARLFLLISYGYVKMLGVEGVTDATKSAILNANYIKNP